MHHALSKTRSIHQINGQLLILFAAFYSSLANAFAAPQSPDSEREKSAILVASSERGVVTLTSDLDIGITISSDIPLQSGTAMEGAFRETEAQLLGAKQRRVFENAGQWGVVRLYPQPSLIPQLMLDMVVLQSDGRQLRVHAMLTGVHGDTLLSDTYLDYASSEGVLTADNEDPFTDLFHRIHNDVATKVALMPESEDYLRQLSFLRYAQQLAPQAFEAYLSREGESWQLLRAPAEQDPMYQRISKLREYELLFVDTIDEQLTSALREIDTAYRLWLRASKEQLDWLEKRRARGVNAEGLADDSAFARHQAVYAAYRSLKIHEQELFELVLDLESESRSTALEIEETVVTLEGTLEQQYREWREALAKIMMLENVF
ncbi:hypothetical protein E0F26_08305 [Candidatus Paraluminiphilus aquimaris]|uniref:Secreted protein n=1 Tax=Candidatus Paraluminiphilus aquimaris TaxID=2518994 RepID=A0ABY6Q6Q7_9GAMM|nr:hypothetical protein [Candidatus Paraluminiphilus aquimaris]UZP74739.1 hypothetical protein E0F26_08305 [Candidatus Paraluminiphilus aquimaris]